MNNIKIADCHGELKFGKFFLDSPNSLNLNPAKILETESHDPNNNVTEFWKINHFVAHETIRIFMFNLVLP